MPTTTNLSRLGSDVLAALAGMLGGERGALLVLDPDAHRWRALATVGLEAGDRHTSDGWRVIEPWQRPYWEHLATAPDPAYVIQGDATALWQDLGIDAAQVAIPLVDDGRALGVLLIASPPPAPAPLAAAARLARVLTDAIADQAAAEARDVEIAHHRTLLDIVREVDRPVELPEVLAAICRKTVEGFGCRQATVFFQSRRHRASLPLADYGTPPHVAARFAGERYLRNDNIPHEDEVVAGRTVVIARAGASAEDLDLLDRTEVELLVLVPLRDDSAAVRGVLNLGFAEPHILTTAERYAIEMVARHASMAIVRAQLLHRTVEAAQFRAAVSALAIELNAATSRTQALQTLCRRGAELFGVHTSALFLRSGDGLVAAAAVGDLALPGMAIALDDEGSPVVRAFVGRDLVLEKERPRRDGAPVLESLRSLLAIPLVEAEGPVGVLVFGALRPRLFRPNVVQEAPLLGALAAAVLRNVTLMGQLQESNQRLHRLSALKDQFLANVSHDLRTPLNIIIGYGQLALENTFGAPPDALREILDRMVQSARQQLALVQDLLDVSRLEFDALSVKPAPMSIANLFADLEFLANSLVRDKPVRVVVDPPNADLWAHADPDRTRQILTNLLGNAAKFTDEGTIGLSADVVGATVRVQVADSGVGIPADQLQAIFEPFRQVEGDRARLGTGLGLAIARRLAELMHGTLTVESSPGHGSIFTLTLPNVGVADAIPTVVNS